MCIDKNSTIVSADGPDSPCHTARSLLPLPPSLPLPVPNGKAPVVSITAVACRMPGGLGRYQMNATDAVQRVPFSRWDEMNILPISPIKIPVCAWYWLCLCVCLGFIDLGGCRASLCAHKPVFERYQPPPACYLSLLFPMLATCGQMRVEIVNLILSCALVPAGIQYVWSGMAVVLILCPNPWGNKSG